MRLRIFDLLFGLIVGVFLTWLGLAVVVEEGYKGVAAIVAGSVFAVVGMGLTVAMLDRLRGEIFRRV